MRSLQIDIAECDDVTESRARRGMNVAIASIADADDGQVYFLAGGESVGGLIAEGDVGWQNRECAECSRRFQEIAAVDALVGEFHF